MEQDLYVREKTKKEAIECVKKDFPYSKFLFIEKLKRGLYHIVVDHSAYKK